MPRPRASVTTLILLVATAASALGLSAAVARLDDEDPGICAVLGSLLVAAIAGAEGVVGIRMRRGANRRLLRFGLACLAFLALVRLLEWGGGAAFVIALAAALAALGFTAALDALRVQATGRGLMARWPGAGELAASTFLVVVLAPLGMFPLGILLGVIIRLVARF